MEEAGAMVVSVPSSNRQRLMDRRKELTDKIAAIDEALGLLDQNPAVARLADLLPYALKTSDY